MLQIKSCTNCPEVGDLLIEGNTSKCLSCGDIRNTRLEQKAPDLAEQLTSCEHCAGINWETMPAMALDNGRRIHNSRHVEPTAQQLEQRAASHAESLDNIAQLVKCKLSECKLPADRFITDPQKWTGYCNSHGKGKTPSWSLNLDIEDMRSLVTGDLEGMNAHIINRAAQIVEIYG